jgi:hypothetical protein
MRQGSGYAALGLIAVLTMLAGGARAVTSPSAISEQVRQLRDDYFRALHEANQARRSAATPEDGIRLYRQKLPNPAQYLEKCLELAKLNPADPGAVDALIAAVEFSDVAWNWKDEKVDPISAIQMLADHADDPKLAEALPYLKDLYNPAARDLLRAIAGSQQRRAQSDEADRSETPDQLALLGRWHARRSRADCQGVERRPLAEGVPARCLGGDSIRRAELRPRR